jgi:dolichol-phosphate mannosyltransferase
MLGRLHEQHHAILASPYMYGGGIVQTAPHRVFVSHVGNSVVKGLLGVRGILTVSSFYRLYTAAAITRLQQAYGPRIVERSGFECMVEITLKMIYLRMSISEVPMVLDTSRRRGSSKMKIAPTAMGYFALARHKGRWRRQAGIAA